LGSDEADGRVDQYGLAATVYQYLCGRLTFEGDSQEVVAARRKLMPPPPKQLVPALPEGVSAALLQALSIDPKQRFPDCANFAKAVMQGLTAPPSPFGLGLSQEMHLSSTDPGVNQIGMTRVKCPACMKILELPVTAKKVKCGGCSHIFRLPGDRTLTPPTVFSQPPKAVIPPPAPAERQAESPLPPFSDLPPSDDTGRLDRTEKVAQGVRLVLLWTLLLLGTFLLWLVWSAVNR
jgi:LSD1 subclass zinc finger protein